MNPKTSLRHALSAIIAAFALWSCANMGSGPDGGPYDETPPHIVSMTQPQLVARQGEKARKHRKTTFELVFNELIAIDNPTENVIVSPPQQEMPNITAAGKRIKVEILDSLKPNTTYTVDFADAIKDNNEGNPLGHFTYIFSTGAQTDTMQMAGYVLNAEDLEPLSGVLVGLHPGTADVAPPDDTLFTHTPFDRVARTNGDGYFSIKGVAADKAYNAYALKDGDGDFAFSQRTELIAFSRRLLVPGSFPDVRHDTVWIDTLTIDSIRHTPFTHFTPDDVVLLAFQEKNQPRTLLKTDRTDERFFQAFFTAPSTHVPVIRGLNFDERDAFVEQRSPGNDTISYWLRDSTLIKQDTLSMCYTYMAWDDSLQQHFLRTDTLDITARTPWAKRMEKVRKDEEKRQKQIERMRRRGQPVDDRVPMKNARMDIKVGSVLSPADNVILEFDTPLASLNEDMVHLFLTVDSVDTPAPFEIDTVPDHIMRRRLRAEWRPEQHYKLLIDSAAVENIYHQVTGKQEKSFSIETLDQFGTLFVEISGLDSLQVTVPDTLPALSAYACCRIELLNGNGQVAYAANVKDRLAEFYYLKEGEYYLRCLIDRNGNGRWDPGSWADRLPPEDVFYRPQSINVRAGWDLNEQWNVTALPRHRQKPDALIKQRATKKQQSSAHERNIKRLEERSGRKAADKKNRQNSSF